jgi:hypothetical protein
MQTPPVVETQRQKAITVTTSEAVSDGDLISTRVGYSYVSEGIEVRQTLTKKQFLTIHLIIREPPGFWSRHRSRNVFVPASPQQARSLRVYLQGEGLRHDTVQQERWAPERGPILYHVSHRTLGWVGSFDALTAAEAISEIAVRLDLPADLLTAREDSPRDRQDRWMAHLLTEAEDREEAEKMDRERSRRTRGVLAG